MAARRPKGKVPFTIAQYAAEGLGEPIILPLDEEKVLELPRPDTDTVLDAEDLMEEGTTTRGLLPVLFGEEKSAEILDACKPLAFPRFQEVMKYLMREVGLGE